MKAVVALLAGAAFFASVSFSFAPARLRLRAVPTSDGSVTFPLEGAGAVSGLLLVFVSRIHNGTGAPVSITTSLDSEEVERIQLEPGATRTMHTVWRRKRTGSTPEHLRFRGPPTGWDVPSAEVANRHGYARGVVNLDVVPKAQPVGRPPWWSVALATLFAGCVAFVRPAPLSGAARALAMAGAGAAALLLAAATLAPLVSPYRLLLAPRTFALALVVVLFPRLLSIARRLRALPFWSSRAGRLAAVCGCGALAAAFYASAALQTAERYSGNLSGFVHLARGWAEQTPFLQERPALARTLVQFDAGYDGQFMYLMAFDPLLTRFAATPQEYARVVDDPPYRYGRIGFSALTRVLSGGAPEHFPAAMLALIVLSHALLAGALATIASKHGLPASAGLLAVVVPGFMVSLGFALPESLAAAGLALGLVALGERRVIGAGLALAAALLIRETSVVLAVALVLGHASRLGRKSSLAILAIALAPVAAWRLFVGARLAPAFGNTAYLPSPGDLTAPFLGLVQLVTAGLVGSQPSPEAKAALVFPVLLVAGLTLAGWALWQRRQALAAAACIYGVVAVSLNYAKIWSHLPSGERGTFELFLSLILLWLTGEVQGRARRAFVFFFAATGLYTFTVSPEGGLARAATLLIR